MNVPDGLNYCCHHADHPERQAVKRHSAGGSVMIWAAFPGMGKTELKFISDGKDARQYTETLSSHLFPFLPKNHPSGFVFQHDNAPSHRTRMTKTWLDTNNLITMTCPAMFPDPIPV
uniref:GK10162 putative n=1 Tax=Albugo laibachii Nc14 TaxID=890382 RepID=F0WFG8_9STRA|nr:GK10162 putative [Albugo laibachii Nc14]|eukprot:CCA19950.1 GK10162 putative [Albugo laibachii Nc14]